jgi:hypothetical protein
MYRPILGPLDVETLWLDCNRYAIWHDANYLVDLAICDRDPRQPMQAAS